MGINNTYKTIKVEEQKNALTIQLFRPEANNSINGVLIEEITQVLISAEENAEIKVIVLEGLPDNFCTGMDFKAVNEGLGDGNANEYYELLKYFSTCSKIIISKVEGKVNAGGIGLIAASDIVIADEKAVFGLSEALFGLLPACVMPFLIRRIGYQKAQWMALTTQTISAQRAHQLGLVDELSTNVNDAVRKNLLRLTRLDTNTIKDLKDYMSKLWILNDQTQKLAVDKITSLVNSEKVRSNIKNFVQHGKFPWDK
jgi:polyketide biosynthesis enoyl-CoA hydratase PksH